MPYLDGTGPMGLGPLTGRGLGYCGAGLRLGYRRRMRGGGAWMDMDGELLDGEQHGMLYPFRQTFKNKPWQMSRKPLK